MDANKFGEFILGTRAFTLENNSGKNLISLESNNFNTKEGRLWEAQEVDLTASKN